MNGKLLKINTNLLFKFISEAANGVKQQNIHNRLLMIVKKKKEAFKKNFIYKNRKLYIN